MTGLQLPPFRMIHAAYVTADLEAGKRRLTAISGVEQFTIYTGVAIDVPGGQAIIDFAIAQANGTTLEAIRPAGGLDRVYRQALPPDPADVAFHHFATRLESAEEWESVREQAARHGIDVPVFGDAAGGTRYIYLDLRPQLGHMLEYIWSEDGAV
jgi:hypothetical protein